MTSRKLRADGQGAEREIPLDDYIEIGVFGENGKTLYLQKHTITAGEHRVTVHVDERPVRAGIDPRFLLIDRDVDDNTIRVDSEQ